MTIIGWNEPTVSDCVNDIAWRFPGKYDKSTSVWDTLRRLPHSLSEERMREKEMDYWKPGQMPK